MAGQFKRITVSVIVTGLLLGPLSVSAQSSTNKVSVYNQNKSWVIPKTASVRVQIPAGAKAYQLVETGKNYQIVKPISQNQIDVSRASPGSILIEQNGSYSVVNSAGKIVPYQNPSGLKETLNLTEIVAPQKLYGTPASTYPANSYMLSSQYGSTNVLSPGQGAQNSISAGLADAQFYQRAGTTTAGLETYRPVTPEQIVSQNLPNKELLAVQKNKVMSINSDGSSAVIKDASMGALNDGTPTVVSKQGQSVATGTTPPASQFSSSNPAPLGMNEHVAASLGYDMPAGSGAVGPRIENLPNTPGSDGTSNLNAPKATVEGAATVDASFVGPPEPPKAEAPTTPPPTTPAAAPVATEVDPGTGGETTQPALNRIPTNSIDVNSLPKGYEATYDNNGMLTGLSKDGQQVAGVDGKGNFTMSDKAKADFEKAKKDAASQTDTAADCQKRGGTMQADGTCTCPKGSTMGKDGVCVEEQRSWWDKLTDWVGNNAVALIGIALGVAALLMAMRKDKSKKDKGSDPDTGSCSSPVTPEDMREDMAKDGNYGSIIPGTTSGYSRGNQAGTGSGAGGGTGGGSDSGEAETDEQKAQEAAAGRAMAGDGAIAAYTYAKKNLDAADAFPAKAEAISEQIDDAQTWRDAFQAVINADYAAYTESARFLTVLATEGSQKSTDIIGSGALPRIQEVKPENDEEEE